MTGTHDMWYSSRTYTHVRRETMTEGLQNVNTEDKPPEPGTLLDPTCRTNALSKAIGRDMDGKVIQHQYDPEVAKQIAKWIGLGAHINEIAQYLNLRPGVIKKHYKHEIETGQFQVNMSVAESILDMTRKEPSVAMFFAKARMGWRDKDKADEAGDGLLNIHIHT